MVTHPRKETHLAHPTTVTYNIFRLSNRHKSAVWRWYPVLYSKIYTSPHISSLILTHLLVIYGAYLQSRAN
jgi:hypothetical protein